MAIAICEGQVGIARSLKTFKGETASTQYSQGILQQRYFSIPAQIISQMIAGANHY